MELARAIAYDSKSSIAAAEVAPVRASGRASSRPRMSLFFSLSTFVVLFECVIVLA